MASASRIVIAPDSFKGSLPADRVATAIARGWLAERPDDDIVLAPMADGGEGTVAAFAAALPEAERMPVRVTGSSGFAIDATWLRLPATDDLPGGTGVVELASTSGIELLDGTLRGWEASTLGFGQAVAAALRAGVSRLILGIGSSASTDGGVGLLTALGARFTDDVETSIAPGVSGLNDLTRADFSKLQALPAGGVVVLTDVTAPLLGSAGAAAVFGEQKGLDAAQRTAAERGLARLVEVVRAGAPEADPDTPGAGAAGGAGFGLLVWGAQLAPGAEHVADVVGLAEAATGAALVVTGEGRLDAQTASGKTAHRVAEIAADVGTPVAAIVGETEAGAVVAPGAVTISLTDLAGSAEVAMADAERLLERAGASLAASFGS